MASKLYAHSTVNVPGTDRYLRVGDELTADDRKALGEPVYEDGEVQPDSHLDRLLAAGTISETPVEEAEVLAAEGDAATLVAAADEASTDDRRS